VWGPKEAYGYSDCIIKAIEDASEAALQADCVALYAFCKFRLIRSYLR